MIGTALDPLDGFLDRARLEDPESSQEEKHALIEQLQKKLEQERQKEGQETNRDLLSMAGSTLEGVEQQQGNGQDEQGNSTEGAGGIQSSLPQEGQQGGKSSSGDGTHGDELRAELADRTEPRGSAPAKAGQGQQKEGHGHTQSERNELTLDRQREATEKSPQSREEKIGRSKASEEIPRGAPPAERFHRPGEEGKEGIKDARYVTVQLPEEIPAESRGTTSGTAGEQQTRTRSKVPVSNVPLPAHIPDAPTEKQQIPLEYRGIIR